MCHLFKWKQRCRNRGTRVSGSPEITIWLLCSLYPPHAGGSSVYADLLVRYLSDVHDVRKIILLTENAGKEWLIREKKALILRALVRRDSLPRTSAFRYVWSYFAVQFAITVFLVAARLSGPRSVVHLHNRLVSPWVRWLCILLRLRTVCDVRDLFFQPSQLRGFSEVIAASQVIFERASTAVSKDHLHILPVPIDLSRIRSEAVQVPNPFGDYWLFVGGISEAKGAGSLIQAYRRLGRKPLGLPKLVLAGDYRLSEPKPSVEEGFVILGEVSWIEALQLIANARLLILPSRSEGMPRVLLEAFALGTPILCGPGIAEVEHFCPESILRHVEANAIARALNRQSKMDSRCSNYPIEEHDVIRVIPRMMEIYEFSLR